MNTHSTGKGHALSIPFTLLAKLSEAIENRMGLHFPPSRFDDLQMKLFHVADEFGFDSIESCAEWLLSSSGKGIDQFAGRLAIGETYFFRDKQVFELLRTHILPGILDSDQHGKQDIRIWSAGCSTGEEPYSLAILLSRMLSALEKPKVTILATDISVESLEKAAAGIYSDWSFRDAPPWLKDDYFEPRGQQFVLAPHIREMVTFSRLNMVRDPYPAIITDTWAMDIILCRNMLMYFSRDCARAVLHNLSLCLKDGGWLVTGSVEVPHLNLPPILQSVHLPGAVFYRKMPAEDKHVALPPAATNETTPATMLELQEKAPDAGRVRLLADIGRLDEALVMCGKVLESDKLNPSLHYLQATILLELDRTDDAEAALKRAIYADQDFVMAHLALANILHRRGKSREAGKYLGKANILLQSYNQGDVPCEAEGLNAGRLREMIKTMPCR